MFGSTHENLENSPQFLLGQIDGLRVAKRIVGSLATESALRSMIDREAISRLVIGEPQMIDGEPLYQGEAVQSQIQHAEETVLANALTKIMQELIDSEENIQIHLS